MDRCAAIVTIGFALIFLQIISCHAAVTGTATNAGQDPAEDSVSSGADGPFPCSYKGKILLTGEDLVLEDCITCTCDNSTLHCSIPNCPLIACSDGQEPVKLKDDCCESCPDPSTQYDVASPHHQSGCVVSFDKESTHFSVGEVYEYNDCISCTCQAHHDAKCVLRACPNSPSVSCYNPVKIKGECCEVCPYDLPVWKVQISEPPVITAGERNEVEFGLVIHLNGWVGRKGAVGEDLIKVSAWADDGRGNRVGYIDQVLTAEQASREIVHKSATYTGFNHTINGIGFVFDATGAICSQMENLCVEISKGDNPSVPDPMLPFTVRGVAGERNGTEVSSNLVSCIPFQGCQDAVTRKRISFSVAKKSGQIAFNPSAVLGWSDVFNNVGGAFDTASGVFSSTVTGSYFFTYQITETDHAQSLPQIRLMKNEEVIITGNSNSNSIIVDLELGDTVWLQLQGELVGTDDIYTSFTGFLI